MLSPKGDYKVIVVYNKVILIPIDVLVVVVVVVVLVVGMIVVEIDVL